MTNILLYVYTLLSLAIIDGAWLYSMGGLYKKWLGHLFAPTVSFTPVIFFYLIYTFGVVYFIAGPAVRGGSTLLATFVSGAALGLVAYATYDLTNHATMKQWPLQVTLIDMVWGALLTGLASVIAVAVFNYFK